MSNSLWSHGLQHTKLPCPSLSLGVFSNSCPLSRQCYLTISSSVAPFSFCLQSFPASRDFSSESDFSNESVLLIRWPKYWSCSFNISPSNEYSELIFFRIYWSDFLAVQGTLERLLQHHTSKASILLRSAFFIVPLSQPYKERTRVFCTARRFLTNWAMGYP